MKLSPRVRGGVPFVSDTFWYPKVPDPFSEGTQRGLTPFQKVAATERRNSSTVVAVVFAGVRGTLPIRPSFIAA